MHHLIYEIVDNSIDEALAGACDSITVRLLPDGSAEIKDDGRGIPGAMHKTGKPTPEVGFTVLHAGGNFGGQGYIISGGLDGVGAVGSKRAFRMDGIHRLQRGQKYTERF